MGKEKKKQKRSRAFIAGFIAGAAVAAIIALAFGPFRWQRGLLAIAAAILVGRLVNVMAQGVDTSKQAPAQRPIPKSGDAAADALIEKGQEMLAQIRQENDRNPDPALSAQMDQLDDVAGRIFRVVAEQPRKAPQIRRFMDYYLPTTLKMLQGFRMMEERQVSGQAAQDTRAQIREAMDVVLTAFQKQLDNLYQNDLLDISTDIDVLETMLRQDGLIDSGLHGDAKD